MNPWAQLGAGLLDTGLGFIQDNQNKKYADAQWQKNYEMQKEFAQNGIRWRVEDAKAAGINPLAAMGASTVGGNPVVVGGDGGSAYSNMGQNISRAIGAGQTQAERDLEDLKLTHGKLQNDLLSTQVAQAKMELRKQMGPPLPSPMDARPLPGQGDSGSVQVNPAQVTASASGVPGQDAGAINDYGFSRVGDSLYIVPSADTAGRTQQGFIPQLEWAIRNKLTPLATHGKNLIAPDPNVYKLPKGMEWQWNPFAQAYQPVRHGDAMDFEGYWSNSGHKNKSLNESRRR